MTPNLPVHQAGSRGAFKPGGGEDSDGPAPSLS